MKNYIYILIAFLSILPNKILSQTKEELALSKGKEAITLMDNGKVDESIIILKECEKLDPKNYVYTYEIAYAYNLKKDYNSAIKVLDRLKNYKNIKSEIYQMSGNCYSYLGNSEKALNEYDSGLKKFPNAGNLYLEKGNEYYQQKKYDIAVLNYTKGVEVEPMFASNYYNLSTYFLNTKDKLSGIIYGEIFMNLERTTKRTLEMSSLLYSAYKEAIQINGDDSKIEFCEVIIDASKISKKNDFELPLCGIFGKNFILATIGQKEVNLNSISEMRTQFVKNFFEKDYKQYPNVLFEYQKTLLDNNILDTYSHYLFQKGAESEYKEWKSSHNKQYEEFVSWYTNPKNYLEITNKTKFISNE